ncbi:DF family (seleno)protein [Microbacterium yannicii]|uniref:DF family (seleno)protein n=1 Tax=Microbacterium yannicii TaxID=671622 RepID=UPI000474EF52|nr:alkylmercury lyase [Microbacterium yannicii]
MSIQILHIEACPNWIDAGNRVREALRFLGSDAEVTFQLVRSTEDAAELRFAGSPTILLDGEDLFPGGEPTYELACRIYATPSGLAGLPTTEQLVAAIGSHER